MCASEALIQAKMGIVTDAHCQPLIYDHTKENFTIREGIIVAKNKKCYLLNIEHKNKEAITKKQIRY